MWWAKRAPEGGEARHQKMTAEHRRHRQPHRALQRDRATRRPHEAMRFFFDASGTLDQLAAFFGQRPAARQAVEQAHAERLFHGVDAPGDGRMLDAERARGFGQAAAARHGEEIADVVPLQRGDGRR
jgi:hypothetical protein